MLSEQQFKHLEAESSSRSSWSLLGSDVTNYDPFEDQETDWHSGKYPDYKPGSMARELTQSEVDSLQSQLEEAVATFKDLPSWNIHGVCGEA